MTWELLAWLVWVRERVGEEVGLSMKRRTWKAGNVVGFGEWERGILERSGIFLYENICRFNERLAILRETSCSWRYLR